MLRTPQMDSADRLFHAYRSAQTRQVIRWPVSNAGPMQIGSETGAGIEYRTSQMQVIPRGGLGAAAAERPVLPPTTTLCRPPVPNNPALNVPPNIGTVPGDPLRGRPLAGAVPPSTGSDHLFSQILSQSRRSMAAGPRGLVEVGGAGVTRLQPQVMQLSVRDDRGRQWYLGNAGSERVMMHSVAEPSAANWDDRACRSRLCSRPAGESEWLVRFGYHSASNFDI